MRVLDKVDYDWLLANVPSAKEYTLPSGLRFLYAPPIPEAFMRSDV